MEKEEFTYEEIDENVIYYVDKYIKRMISNTKISYLRKDKCSMWSWVSTWTAARIFSAYGSANMKARNSGLMC